MRAACEQGEMNLVGAQAVEWMGVPLKADGRTIGVVAVQTYREDRRYSPDDLELLTFVGQHIATALARARAIEETRQRNAELAVVNEVGAALAGTARLRLGDHGRGRPDPHDLPGLDRDDRAV